MNENRRNLGLASEAKRSASLPLRLAPVVRWVGFGAGARAIERSILSYLAGTTEMSNKSKDRLRDSCCKLQCEITQPILRLF